LAAEEPPRKALWTAELNAPVSALAASEALLIAASHNGDKVYIQAFSAKDGALLWTHTQSGAGLPTVAAPVIADTKVFVLSAAGELAALDAKTGKSVWSLNLPREFDARAPLKGYASIPIL